MTETEREFHLKEYDGVRAEVSTLLARIENLFKYSVIAAATVFAWLLTNSMGSSATGDLCLKAPRAILVFAWYIPAVFIYFAFALATVNHWRARSMEKYLCRLEVALGSNGFGWETTNDKGFPWLTVATGLVWVAMMVGSMYAAERGKDMLDAGQKVGICPTLK